MRWMTWRALSVSPYLKHQSGTFRKLGRTASHRWAMLRTMVTQLIEHERIETTVAKAWGLLRTSTRPTLNLLLLLHASVS